MSTSSTSAPQVSYDSRSLMLDGQRVLLIIGEMHFSRMPRAEWESIIVRSKAMGLNAIALYVFWSAHEPENGRFDFEDEADIGHFLDLCAKHSLHVLLRPGPYCCAEWNYGGFPFWLREVEGIEMRTWNEPYFFHVRRYFTALWEQISPRFYPAGPIILTQVENEYDNIAPFYGEAGQRYLQWMVELVNELGLLVPTITCSGGADGAIECVNGFSVKSALDKTLAERPGQPGIWTENWPGWYNTWGYDRHVRAAGEVALEIVRFLAAGGTGWSYYMWHGGTNFGRTAMYLQTTRYGLDAPLNEWGLPTAKARALETLHTAVKQHEASILQGTRQAVIALPDGVEGNFWLTAGHTFGAFANTGDTAQNVKFGGDQFVIPPRGACFISQVSESETAIVWCNWDEEWQSMPPDISDVQEEEMAWQSVDLSGSEWQHSIEPLPSEREGGVGSVQPIEQLDLTQDESDYCWYASEVARSEQGVARLVLRGAGDFFYIYVNGVLQARTSAPLLEKRGSIRQTLTPEFDPSSVEPENGGADFCQAFDIELNAGANRLEILSCALGLIKGDWMLDAPMREERKGIWGQVYLDGAVIENWRMLPALLGEKRLSSSNLSSAPTTKPSWYQAEFSLEAEQLEIPYWAFDAKGLDKGMVWVNGHCLGRYWQEGGHGYGQDGSWHSPDNRLTDIGNPPQRRYRIPQSWLSEQNEIIVLSETGVAPLAHFLCFSRS